MGQFWVDCDHSAGPYHGNIYILCSVEPYYSYDPLDVMFTRSTDGGQTWSTPVRINDDPTDNNAWQWFGTMSVAPNGRIDAVWNDTRKTGQDNLSELYYSYSTDAGMSWSQNIPISPVFDSHLGWPQQEKLGDYYHMNSDNAGANLAYAATFNGEQDVYFVRIGDRDCNGNGVPDEDDVAGATSSDCNTNTVPDECEPDCNTNNVADECDIDPNDPDGDGLVSPNCNNNRYPDECEPDCNGNDVADECDIRDGTSLDCNVNQVPDECDLADGTSIDCNTNSIPDECETDCNGNGVPDDCDLRDCDGSPWCDDCQPNGIMDSCEPTPAQDDCNRAFSICSGFTHYGFTTAATNDGSATCGDSDTTPDVWYYYQPDGYGSVSISLCGSEYDTVLSVHSGCPGSVNNQLACNDDYCGQQSKLNLSINPLGDGYWIRISGKNGATGKFQIFLTGPNCMNGPECNNNGIPDECEPDCNDNGQPDDCDIADESSLDINDNGFPDECEILGDLNCDGGINEQDINPFVLALVNPAVYQQAYPDCNVVNADCNRDNYVNSLDIDPFVDMLIGG